MHESNAHIKSNNLVYGVSMGNAEKQRINDNDYNLTRFAKQ